MTMPPSTESTEQTAHAFELSHGAKLKTGAKVHNLVSLMATLGRNWPSATLVRRVAEGRHWQRGASVGSREVCHVQDGPNPPDEQANNARDEPMSSV